MTDGTPKIGDCVIYRQSGVFRITDIGEKDFGQNVKKTYLTLSSMQDRSMNIYIPADKEHTLTLLRSPLTRKEAMDCLAATIPYFEWIDDTRTRNEVFTKAIQSPCLSDVIPVYRALSLYKRRMLSQKKKFYASDEKLLARAENLLLDEFSFALEMDREKTKSYLDEKLGIFKESSEQATP